MPKQLKRAASPDAPQRTLFAVGFSALRSESRANGSVAEDSAPGIHTGNNNPRDAATMAPPLKGKPTADYDEFDEGCVEVAPEADGKRRKRESVPANLPLEPEESVHDGDVEPEGGADSG